MQTSGIIAINKWQMWKQQKSASWLKDHSKPVNKITVSFPMFSNQIDIDLIPILKYFIIKSQEHMFCGIYKQQKSASGQNELNGNFSCE